MFRNALAIPFVFGTKFIEFIRSIVVTVSARLAIVLIILVAQTSPLTAQRSRAIEKPRPQYISFAEAQPVVSTLTEILPAEFKGKSEPEIAAAWPAWIALYDAQIRARLARG